MTEAVPLSDALCVERARRGDMAAFDVLVRRHYRAAFALALARTGNRLDAEDVCQDAFVSAAEHLEQCRDPAKFAPWLLRIVRNRAHNFRAYERVRATEVLDHDTAAAPGVAGSEAERAELRERLESALAQLSAAQRTVVLLHDMEGWPHRDIARELGTSEGMSRQHLFAARRKLRGLLSGYVYGECAHE